MLFPYQQGEPKAASAVADAAFNKGKGELAVQLTDRGVRVQPVWMATFAILRANVVFPVEDDSIEFDLAERRLPPESSTSRGRRRAASHGEAAGRQRRALGRRTKGNSACAR